MKAIAACCAIVALAAGIAWWRYGTREYFSTSVLRPRTTDVQEIHDAERIALSDYTLASIIERENLYPDERKRSGIGSCVRHMRDQSIRVQESENLGIVIILSFRYPVASQAIAATHDLAAAIQSAIPCEVLVDASAPVDSQKGRDFLPLGIGCAAGLAAASVWWLARRRSRA